ncbi:Pkr1-domain-containing protein [Ascobolus immersus RN42]|uniref:Pkr1-domain-containing protein n=1 Tax=Ascobolus immersus RN42 TaxID=1160509 RepID=A0A3N4HG04_ASCIM|nr:Pkr1-domain-containing protein [Ascobolus immersus RN42]
MTTDSAEGPSITPAEGFFASLIGSVFTPGIPTSLVQATHTSFALLHLILLWLLYMTRSIHFVALTVIAGCLWGTVTWFLAELKKVDEEAERLRAVKREKGELTEDEAELTEVGKDGSGDVKVGKEGKKEK